MILFSGALLLTPASSPTRSASFCSSAVRRWAFKQISRRVQVNKSFTVHSGGQTHTYTSTDVIDGEYEDVSPPKKPTHEPTRGPSGWTKH